MKGNTLQFYNKLTEGFVRLHPDGTVDAIGEKTDNYGKARTQYMVLDRSEGRQANSYAQINLYFCIFSFILMMLQQY